MKLLICAATQFEIEPFLQEKINVEILITGVGIPSTVFHLTKKLSHEKYDYAIQAGIAGMFTNKFNLEESVLIKADTFADSGTEENGNFKTLFETNFSDKNDFPYTEGWLLNDSHFLEKNILTFAKAVTVNKVTDNNSQNQLVKEKFLADIETMEGAAFHYVCLQQKINFLQLRSISNHVGERDKSKWRTQEAIKNLNLQLLKIIENL